MPIINDQFVEGTERFLGQIISGGGIDDLVLTAPTATVDITDNDSKWIPISGSPPSLFITLIGILLHISLFLKQTVYNFELKFAIP